MIEVRDLEFGYNSTLVLKRISFEVKDGEFWGLIGPNGSGKSTLLRCLCRVHTPKKGIILLEGKPLSSWKAKEVAKKLAVVPQESHFAFNFSVREIVLMGRSPFLKRFQLEGGRDYEVVRRSLEFTDTLSLADRPINEISGGERQRVVLARALAQEPQVMLLDEPTVHLDIHHQLKILEILKKLNREKKMTILLVLHDLNLASEYCEKLILLGGGEVKAIGRPEEILVPDLIEEVYQTKPLLEKNPVTGAPHLILVPQERDKEEN